MKIEMPEHYVHKQKVQWIHNIIAFLLRSHLIKYCIIDGNKFQSQFEITTIDKGFEGYYIVSMIFYLELFIDFLDSIMVRNAVNRKMNYNGIINDWMVCY